MEVVRNGFSIDLDLDKSGSRDEELDFMTRFAFITFNVVVLLLPAAACAQFNHPHFYYQNAGQRGNNSHQQSVANNSPFGNSGTGFGRHFGHYRGMPFLFPVYVVQPMQVTTYPTPIYYEPVAMPLSYNPDKPSTPAAKLKSLDYQAKGDQRMREQKWGEAREAYANAIRAAHDRGDAHFKLAICYAVIQRFDSAVREFKRALKLDPQCVKNAKPLKVLFGPDSQIVRNSIISKLRVWAKEDLNSSDRQFLYGAMLRLDDDPMSHEVLESAMQANRSDDSSHIARFLNPGTAPNKAPVIGLEDQLPAFNDQPAPLAIARPVIDLRFPATASAHLVFAEDAPVPMPDGVVRGQGRLAPLVDAPVPMP